MHLVCILDARNVWEFHQSGGRLPLVHLTLASLPSFHPPSPSFNKCVSPWVCARYWAGGWESSSEPTRPFPRLTDLADWSTSLYFPSYLLDQWLFPPELLQEKYNASYGGSQNSSAWMGKLRIGAGVSTVSSWRTPLKTPVLNHPSLSKHILLIMSSSNTFWLGRLTLKSLLNQAKLRSFSWNWHIEKNISK